MSKILFPERYVEGNILLLPGDQLAVPGIAGAYHHHFLYVNDADLPKPQLRADLPGSQEDTESVGEILDLASTFVGAVKNVRGRRRVGVVLFHPFEKYGNLETSQLNKGIELAFPLEADERKSFTAKRVRALVRAHIMVFFHGWSAAQRNCQHFCQWAWGEPLTAKQNAVKLLQIVFPKTDEEIVKNRTSFEPVLCSAIKLFDEFDGEFPITATELESVVVTTFDLVLLKRFIGILRHLWFSKVETKVDARALTLKVLRNAVEGRLKWDYHYSKALLDHEADSEAWRMGDVPAADDLKGWEEFTRKVVQKNLKDAGLSDEDFYEQWSKVTKRVMMQKDVSYEDIYDALCEAELIQVIGSSQEVESAFAYNSNDTAIELEEERASLEESAGAEEKAFIGEGAAKLSISKLGENFVKRVRVVVFDLFRYALGIGPLASLEQWKKLFLEIQNLCKSNGVCTPTIDRWLYFL